MANLVQMSITQRSNFDRSARFKNYSRYIHITGYDFFPLKLMLYIFLFCFVGAEIISHIILEFWRNFAVVENSYKINSDKNLRSFRTRRSAFRTT